ncbi:MAG TPA: hypothetical protein VJ890_16075 [Vineibacter sp.]|nr:hypothetical protein [Vineibacter sp.]
MVQLAYSDYYEQPFFFNLSGPVGKGYPNARTDDVLLVQYAIGLMGTGKRSDDPLGPSFAKVKATGTTDDALLAAIMELQSYRRRKFGPPHEVDGIVSVARTRSGAYVKDAAYNIYTLNLAVKYANPTLWPRFDKDPRCPAVLGQAIRDLLARGLAP